uniref:Uncharacterized protein n=1 Tax=Setaria digitata TaxID=48799 RepID=A0A915Q7L5_9BILA
MGIAVFHTFLLILIVTSSLADELVFVQIIWRHGDRAPIFAYPTDIHQEEAWRYGWGELTELGMKQQFALGDLIRQRYIERNYNFLSHNYHPKEVYIRSTDVNRTLVSAMANLAGMYPTGIAGRDYPKSEKWPSHWTPIPIHTVENNEDYVGNVFSRCPRASQLTAIIRCSKQYQKVADENKDFFDYVSKKSGMRVNLDNVYIINDIHYAETVHNMSQPAWITEDVSRKLLNLSVITSGYLYGISTPYLPELIKLRGGKVSSLSSSLAFDPTLCKVETLPVSLTDCLSSKLKKIITGSLLKLLLENMIQKKECLLNPENPKCSSHDTTIGALMATLGDEEEVLHGGLPQYTASIAVELWNTTDFGFAVKILFHEAFHHPYRVITHLTKGCPSDSDFCPLNTFRNRSRNFLPVNIKRECLPKKGISRKVYKPCEKASV